MTRPSEDSTPPTPALLRFLERRFEDEAAGRRFDVDHYIALFPDIADQIRREWERIEAPRPAVERGPAPGEDLGPYRIERRIGRGGFGVVYLAKDLRVHRPVAIKFLSSALAMDGDAIVRFRREAEAIARLEHPAIGALYDASLESPIPYLVMRYVEGEPLAARILAAKGTKAPLRLDPQNGDGNGAFTGLALFFATIARAIATAHKAGVVHRDLKPANIMVTPDGEPVVLDFGLARRVDDETLTRADEIIGTLAYMAPETIAGRTAGPAADIYAIGATLYECLALEKPFTAPSSQALMRRIAEDEPPALKARCQDIPGDLAAITMHALEKDPLRRYADADALADDLAAFAAGEEVSAKRPSAIARTLRRARRRPALTALCIFLAIGGPWAGYLWRTNRAQTPIVRAAAERERRESAERMIEDGFYRVGQWQCVEALPIFEAALRDVPDDVAALGGKTLALIILKRNADALRFLDLARDRTAQSPALRLLEDEAAAGVNGTAGAASRASAPAPGDQGAPIYYYFLGWTALRRGEAGDPEGYRDALRAFSDAVAASPSARAIFHFEWARAAGLAGDAESARRAAAAIRTLWPKSANGAFYAAFGLTGAGAHAEAVVEYRRALALEPQHRMAELGLGAALLCEKDFDAAIDLYTDILARDKDDWTAHQNIALAYVNRDDPNDRALALGHAEKAATLDPENAVAHDLYLNLLGEGVDAARTLAELRRWAAVRPNDALALLNLAMELADRPDPASKDEARALARRAKAAVQAGQNLPPAALEALENLLR